MKTIYTILISFVIGAAISFSLTFFSSNLSPDPTITGQVILEQPTSQYTYTTAICNDNNECIDVLVECINGNVISLTPSSDLLDLGPEFDDFREKQDQFCE
jgi:hypothetical protein